jgi:hypothetical protein
VAVYGETKYKVEVDQYSEHQFHGTALEVSRDKEYYSYTSPKTSTYRASDVLDLASELGKTFTPSSNLNCPTNAILTDRNV